MLSSLSQGCLLPRVASDAPAQAAATPASPAQQGLAADEGPSQSDLDNAKDYLIGSYPLRFDTNSKIATQLLGLRMDGFEPDYVEKRNGMIAAVTLDDLKRVAHRMLDTKDLIVTIVGKPVMDPAKKG